MHFCFGSHCADRLGGETAGHVYAGLHASARFAVAEGDVAILVHRYRRQPSVAGIRIEGAGLEQCRMSCRTASVAKFEPFHGSVLGVTARARSTNNEPFLWRGLRAVVTVSKAIHV